MKNSLNYKKRARVLKALANEARLMIVERLGKGGECSVGELAEVVGAESSSISKHLAVLRSQGIVEDRREGSTVFYRLMTPCVLAFLSCASEILDQED